MWSTDQESAVWERTNEWQRRWFMYDCTGPVWVYPNSPFSLCTIHKTERPNCSVGACCKTNIIFIYFIIWICHPFVLDPNDPMRIITHQLELRFPCGRLEDKNRAKEGFTVSDLLFQLCSVCPAKSWVSYSHLWNISAATASISLSLQFLPQCTNPAVTQW